jgi:hypothetical protein
MTKKIRHPTLAFTIKMQEPLLKRLQYAAYRRGIPAAELAGAIISGTLRRPAWETKINFNLADEVRELTTVKQTAVG